VNIHPAADIFPMMSDEELRELADDIKANGLNHAIVIQDGTLIDGRNRLAACKLAGVTPHYEPLPAGVDARAFILSENVKRRHMNKGQQAMAVAMMYPEPAKGGRGKILY
jgi:ParB-like chromosome segregation protein Spo0J